MSEDWAIKIEHLSKVYKIFDKPTDRVKEALNPFRKRYSRDFYALNDVSLTIKKGETVRILWKSKVSRVAKIEYAGKYGFIRLKNLA